MPFFFNIKALLGVVVTLTILVSIIFFFAFFAIIALPLILLLYLFRRKIFSYFLKKNFSHSFYNEQNKSNFNNFDENKNKDYIEVDYEKNNEEDEKN